MPQPPSDCPEKSPDYDAWMTAWNQSPFPTKLNSLEPGDKVCEPMLQERAKRKETDEEIFHQLDSIRVGVDTTKRLTKRGVVGIGMIFLLAGLEYLGVLGEGKPPVWARAVFDVAAWMIGAK